ARMWSCDSGTEVHRFGATLSKVNAVAISKDGRSLLSGSDNAKAHLWDLTAGREVRRLEGHSSWVLTVALSADSRFALTGSADSTARMWDLASGHEVQRFAAHPDRINTPRTSPDFPRFFVNAVAFSPDSRFVLTGSSDGTVRRWDAKTGDQIHPF